MRHPIMVGSSREAMCLLWCGPTRWHRIPTTGWQAKTLVTSKLLYARLSPCHGPMVAGARPTGPGGFRSFRATSNPNSSSQPIRPEDTARHLTRHHVPGGHTTNANSTSATRCLQANNRKLANPTPGRPSGHTWCKHASYQTTSPRIGWQVVARKTHSTPMMALLFSDPAQISMLSVHHHHPSPARLRHYHKTPSSRSYHVALGLAPTLG
jgi:hypothetical protein